MNSADNAAALAALLSALGNTPDAIAARLHADGFRGQQDHPFACVLAVYLAANGCKKPLVDGCFASVNQGPDVRLSPPLQAFVEQFDQGLHPELIACDCAD